LLDADLLSIL
jgi:novel plant SNARE